MSETKSGHQWLEEYGCGCTNVFDTKREAPGYCPTHGEDRIHMTKIPGKDLEKGLAR